MIKAFEASIGIDIAKAKVDVAVLDASNSPKHRTFTNDLEGFHSLYYQQKTSSTGGITE